MKPQNRSLQWIYSSFKDVKLIFLSGLYTEKKKKKKKKKEKKKKKKR